MAFVNFSQLSSLPESPTPNTIYFIKNGTEGRFYMYSTDALSNMNIAPIGTVDTINDSPVSLRDKDPTGLNACVVINNGIFQLFQWDAANTSADDGVTIIKPSSITGAGRYVLNNGYVNANSDDLDNSDKLKLADRSYVPTAFSGHGRKILRKNIQNVTRYDTQLTLAGTPNASGNITISIDGTSYDLPIFADVPASSVLNILGGFDRYLGIGSGAYTGYVIESLEQTTALPMNMGVFQKDNLVINSAPTTAGNINVTLDGVVYPVAVLTTDTTVTVAYKILKALPATANWDYNYTPNSSTITFIARTVGTQTPVSIDGSATGVTATISNVTAGVAQTDLWTALSNVALQNYNVAINQTAGTVTFTAKTSGPNDTIPRLKIPASGYYWELASWVLGSSATQPADLATMILEKPFSGVILSVAGNVVTVSKIGSSANVIFTDNGLGITATQTTTNSQQTYNILDPSVLTDANTVYEVRYDFYSNGNIALPENVTFEFSSGSFNAINFSGNNTLLKNHVRLYNSTFTDTVNKKSYTSWFNGTTAFMIQSALMFFEAQAAKGQIYVDAQNGNITAPVRVNLDFARVDFLGNQGICFNANHLNFFTLTTLANSATYKRMTNAFTNASFVSTNRLGTAIYIESAYNGNNGGNAAQSVYLNRINVQYMFCAVATAANAYGVSINSTDIGNCVIGVQRIPSDNSGERIQINKGFIAQNTIGVLAAGGGCSMYANEASFDHNECHGFSTQGGTLFVNNCHTETHSGASTTAIWKCSDDKSFLQVDGSVILSYILTGSPLAEPLGYAKAGNKLFSIRNSYVWAGASKNSVFIDGDGAVDFSGAQQIFTYDGNTNVARVANSLNMLKSFANLQNAAILTNGGTLTQIPGTDLIKVTVGTNTEFRLHLRISGNAVNNIVGTKLLFSSLVPLSATTTTAFCGTIIYYTNKGGELFQNAVSGHINAGGNGVIATTSLHDVDVLKPTTTQYDMLDIVFLSSGLSSFVMSLPYVGVGDANAKLQTVAENTLESVTPANLVVLTKASWAQTLNSVLTAWSNADYRYYNGLVSLEASCTLAATTATTITLPYAAEHSGTRLCGDVTITLTAGSNTASIQAATTGNKTLNFIYNV